MSCWGQTRSFGDVRSMSDLPEADIGRAFYECTPWEFPKWDSGYTARRTDPACDKANARESQRKAPYIQPKPAISANSLRGQQCKTGAGHECADHIAPRRRRCALGRARALKAPEGYDERNEHKRVGCE